MGLQEQIAEAIIIAFDELGGDPQTAIEAAMSHRSVRSWIDQESTMIAVAGGAEMAIPGLHALTIPAGISFLFHKMAYMSWGIGALKGAYIIETPQHSDLRNILRLWANESYFNAHILEHLAISMDAFEYALTEDGYAALQKGLEKDTENTVMDTLHVLDRIVREFGGDERAQRMVQSITGRQHMESMVITARDNVPVIEVGQRPLNPRISTKLAGRLAANISTRIPARLVMGWIPLAGPILNAFLNAQTLRSMADSAISYYDNTLSRASFDKETTTDTPAEPSGE
jgi:hypothetical protein